MSRVLDKMVDSFQDELQKISGAGGLKDALKGRAAKVLPAAAAGAATYEGLRRANQDRKMGRQIRLQQGGSF